MYLFFVRDFNDIDHITPIVWKMKGDNYQVAVYCINPEYDINSDYRLNFLKDSGVEVDYIYNVFDEQLGRLHRILYALFRQCLEVQRGYDHGGRQELSFLSKAFSRFARKTAIRLYILLRKKFYDSKWAQKILEYLKHGCFASTG